MTNGLNSKKAQLLTYLVYVLLTLLTCVSLYHFYMIANLPDNYVRLERYICDITKVEKNLEKIGDKLDRLFERQPERDR